MAESSISEKSQVKRSGEEIQEGTAKRFHFSTTDSSVKQKDDLTSSSAPTLSVKEYLYDTYFPFYKQPMEVGCFSLDSERRFFNDARQLKYYVPPENGKSPNFNLPDGYKDRYIKRDDNVKENLDHLLRWILNNKRFFKIPLQQHEKTDASCSVKRDFVTWRGHLTKILTTPYEYNEGWLMAVTLFNGTYYISEVETEAAKKKREMRPEYLDKMMYMGYKFEQYMCASDPQGKPNPAGIVNTNEAYCTVIQAKLKWHSLLFSGEVDCKDQSYHTGKAPSYYVELKTSKEVYTQKEQRNLYRYKLLKWWAQSFLPGVPRIIVGFRDNDGTVVSLQTFETMKIFHVIKNEKNMWKPTVCVNFCDAFLSFIKKVVTQDDYRKLQQLTLVDLEKNLLVLILIL
ncbi:decapping and exoribonuclease protein isoform X3 [Latimeria chalumnae]|uniref:decapping and exoribonuclease protein isoform X3 n=1 Tax=Latimeria chalumnae TaxID=7897 RepID=UPI0006D8F83D|nr:PREDICTED: decapping and exoribonuclease protein isoform X3 [Latimeria chalumnae]|eukprot:XP_014349784.1 PREDICTED: decapping and exoribonuclease protein isoform X3 [Latimeria chalumnae]